MAPDRFSAPAPDVGRPPRRSTSSPSTSPRGGLCAGIAGKANCAGPPGPALRATEPAISAHEEADMDVGRRTEWSPAPRITQLAQNGKTSDIRLQPVNVAQGRAS